MNSQRKNFKFLALALLVLVAACGEKKPTFSLLPDRKIFEQGEPKIIDNKLDILWVIDNSGSMAAEQANLVDNFEAFIGDFTTKGWDFKIAVTTTDAYKTVFTGNSNLSKFRDGVTGNNSGVFVIVPSTPNLLDVFMTNAVQGINGSGDERAFQSFKTALDNPLNAGFLRSDSFMAVIIVSDEDDFSTSNPIYTSESYSNPELHTIQSYVDYLDGLTQTTGDLRRYSVSTIGIFDAACLAANNPWGNLAERYAALTDATQGIKGDICSPSFANDLQNISARIAELSTQFFLDRLPIPSSIYVEIDGVTIPESTSNGWTYHADANSIRFHGSAIPKQGAQIVIDFDPVTIL